MTGERDTSEWTEPPATRREWERVAADPDVRKDLGYDPMDLEVMDAGDRPDDLVVLPSDEEVLRDEAFIVVSEAAVRDLGDWA